MLSSVAVFCFPRLKPILKGMMGICYAEAYSLQSLKSVKIMDAMSEVRLANQTDSVIFLQIANES